MRADGSSSDERWDFGPRPFQAMAWYGEADAPDGVPVLDHAAMRDASGAPLRRRQLGALRDAVTGSGFLYLKNHGIAEADIEELANVTRAFYGRPEEEKARWDRRAEVRGYTGYRAESTARFFGTSRGKDLCMKYTMGPELTPAEVAARITCEEDLASNAYSPNVFPDDRFRAAWLRYYEAVHRVSGELLELLGDALELPADGRRIWREMLVEKSCGELRFFQYPDVPARASADVPGNVADRMAAHFDMDVVTLLHQTPCDGGFVSLEAKRGDHFYKVPAIRGTLVVNLGEVIRLLTGGRVRATVHRVARPPRSMQRGSARDVTVFFQAPPLSAELRPVSFGGDVGSESVFDDFYRLAGDAGTVRFAELRARLFAEFMRQAGETSEAHEADAHLFSSPASFPSGNNPLP